MAEITRQRVGELVRGVFQILMENPDGLKAKEVIQKLEALVPPTPFEDSVYPNNPSVRRRDKIVRFSTINPVKAGWMMKDRGLWSITEDGIKAFDEFPDPETFAREAGRLYKKWKDQQPEEEAVPDPDEGETGAALTLEEAEEAAWSEIEAHLGEMNPYDFQNLVAGLLRAMGYHVAWISPPGPDKGLDILAHTDPLGIAGARIKVQVKRRADRSAVQDIRSFMAILGDGDVGIFVCSGGFTKDAEQEARGQERRRIMLLDARRLFDLWVEHYEKIPERHRRLMPLRPIYFLAPDD
jgi:restriction system protein